MIPSSYCHPKTTRYVRMCCNTSLALRSTLALRSHGHGQEESCTTLSVQMHRQPVCNCMSRACVCVWCVCACVCAQIELRAASRQTSLPDLGRIESRFESLRKRCGFENVPILRNRQRVLGVVESPWDTFGPTPPPDLGDFENLEGF